MKKKRIAYLDFIKVFTMFIVTFGHCAQALSCQTFPERIIPNDFFVSVHMPLFMIASGFVLNFDKIRATPMRSYLYNKFSRLIVPMFTWIVIYSIATMQVPSVSNFLYWYLAALFFSLVTIRFFALFISDNTMLMIVTLLVVCAVPIYKTSHTNFMFPFLIYGVLLKKFINKMNLLCAMTFAIVFSYLYVFYWGIKHTVYLSPLDTMNISKDMLYSFILRLTIGITGSTFIFLLARKFDHTPFINRVSSYGRYTLIFYTMTTVINGFTSRLFHLIDFNYFNYKILDISAFVFAIVQMSLIYLFAKKVEKSQYCQKFLLGN